MQAGFTGQDISDQSGKTFLVTGANAGIGFAAARALAEKGGRVLLACRSEQKAGNAMDEIRSTVPAADLHFIPLDQADLASVKRAAKLIKKERRLDVLINNAGILTPPYQLTADGFESQFGVNHLGTFALTSLLLDKLADTPHSRIVVTSSLAHRRAQIFFDDINAEKSYRAMKRYMQSKLANLLFLYELDRRLRALQSPTMAVACHPGIAATELIRHLPFLIQKLGLPLIELATNNAEQGSWPTLMAATGKGITGGDYCGPGKFRETSGPAVKVKPAGKARKADTADRLWDLSIEMTGIDPGI